MTWLPLALLTATAFGSYTIFIKLGSSKIDQVLGAAVLQVVAAILGTAYAAYVKLAGRTLAVRRTGLIFAVLAGPSVGLAEVLTFVVFARGAPAALATPVIMGGSVLVAAVAGVFLLGERPGLVQVTGLSWSLPVSCSCRAGSLVDDGGPVSRSSCA